MADLLAAGFQGHSQGHSGAPNKGPTHHRAPLSPAPRPRFFKTPSGVRVQLLAEGSGPAAAAGDVVLIDFVLRRSNGCAPPLSQALVSRQALLHTAAVLACCRLASHLLLSCRNCIFSHPTLTSPSYFIYGTPEGVSFQPRDVPVGPVALPLVSALFSN